MRKVCVLQDFGGRVTVVAPVILEEIKALPEICFREKEFSPEELVGMKLVVAATDDVLLNRQISIECKKRKIPVNAVDQIEDCSFIFPAYHKEKEVVAAFSSGGQSPVVTQYLKKQAEPILTEHLGELTEYLGGLRETVKKRVEPEECRKQVYQEILQLGLRQNRIPEEEEVEKIISRQERK